MLIIEEHFHYYNQECHREYLYEKYPWTDVPRVPKPLCFKNNDQAVCFNVVIDSNEEEIKKLTLETSYFIGLNYVKEWELPLLVEPKVNTDSNQLDFHTMLVEALKEPENFNHLDGLMDIDFNAPWIEVDAQRRIELTPFLVIQFLMAVKQLVRKGLKKSYYSKTENLRNRVKGKILVGAQVKHNILKQQLTKTVCTYQEFGFDTPENRFIKYVLQFIYAYISNYQEKKFKTQVKELLNYNLAAFHQVGDETFKWFSGKESNPFYKVYNTVFSLGNQILKLMDYSYEKSTAIPRKYPPHWIDMSKLFELYVFKKLRERFPNSGEVTYHVRANYQELDYLIKSGDFKAVVDAKYKPRYKSGNPSKQDARQLSGYARLNRIYKDLEIDKDEIIPVYFVYPQNLDKMDSGVDSENGNAEEAVDLLCEENPVKIINDPNEGEKFKLREVKAYRKMYLQEVDLPIR